LSFLHCKLNSEIILHRQVWRQTTWGGWAVRILQDLARRIKPFIDSVIEAMKDEDTGFSLSPVKLLVYVGLRVYVVVVALLSIYALSRVFQMLIGSGDIVMEEEVVIVHEHETEEEAAKARAALSRSKKQKAQ
jgi:CBS domain-containing protein